VFSDGIFPGAAIFCGFAGKVGMMEFGAEYGGGCSELDDDMSVAVYVDGSQVEVRKKDDANREMITLLTSDPPAIDHPQLPRDHPRTMRGNVRVIERVHPS
jgi:hypothetical protein